MTNCKLCGQPKLEWQVYCGAACCAAYEGGERDPNWRALMDARTAAETPEKEPGR